MGQLLSVKGNKIVRNGKPVRLRGVNFGTWMLIEHFMIGLPWTEYKMRQQFREILGEEAYHRFFDTYMDAFITEDDFKFLADMKCTFIRLPFNYRHFEDDSKPGVFKEESFKYFDRVIDLCRKYDMYVLLDLHAAAGVQARDWNAESAYGEAFLWEHRCFTERTAGLWKFIASRYVNEDRVMGYEILNEPLAPSLDVFHEFNMACIDAIREVDKDHIIVVESNEWGKKIDTLTVELDDPLVVPSLHHYPSQFSPFNKMQNYPGEFEGKQYGRQELFETMKDAYNPGKIDRPFFCGEFNHGNMALLDDLLSIFEEHDIHWTIWSYKTVMPMSLLYPSENTPWKKFYLNDQVRSVREGYHKSAAVFTEALKQNVPLVTEGDIRHFMGQSMHHWHGITLSKVLNLLKENHMNELESMAESFAFKNCTIDKTRFELLKKHGREL